MNFVEVFVLDNYLAKILLYFNEGIQLKDPFRYLKRMLHLHLVIMISTDPQT